MALVRDLVRNGEKAVAFTWFRLCRMQRNHWESQRALSARTRKRGGRHSHLGRETYGPWRGPVTAETLANRRYESAESLEVLRICQYRPIQAAAVPSGAAGWYNLEEKACGQA